MEFRGTLRAIRSVKALGTRPSAPQLVFNPWEKPYVLITTDQLFSKFVSFYIRFYTAVMITLGLSNGIVKESITAIQVQDPAAS